MKQYSKIEILEETPVLYSILYLAIPSMLSMLVNILYNVTDTFFIGKLNDPYKVAGVSVALPYYNMLMAIAGIFANGGASYLSRLLGKRDIQTARETTTTAVFSVGIVSIIAAALGLLFIPTYLKLTSATGLTAHYAQQYLTAIFIGSPIIMMKFTLIQFLRAEGAAKDAMIGLFIGTGANIVLDPLFIFYFKMDVVGAGIATVIGQGLGMLYFCSYYLKKKSLAAPSRQYLHPRWSCYKEILAIGIPSSLSQIMMSVGNAISFNLASAYTDHTIAALGVASRVFSIVIFSFIGLSIGVQPLIGFNYGAQNYGRMKKIILTANLICLAMAAFFTIFFAIFPGELIAVFIKDISIIAIGKMILEAYVFAIPFAGVGMILMATLQSMGKALPAFIVSLSRQGLVYIPMLFLLNHLFQFNGLIFAMPIADVITTILSFIFVYHITKQLKTSLDTKPSFLIRD
ncbi:MAG TPA: MATE family efflux transporter [Candidatus Cloacimonas sp.]|jgi:putative MATE family efflux protein|nr:MATE family efflux transporter [Candidatus Cloacimonas sp.]MDD2250214.1 MATE family efflux transporter [Candidatus Cloacimonadota bacterium]MCK9164722.1 MATE family efflux transporter [Candidatus Cloacimonas sp.]MDD3869074.1 MATE family efflux transporter [Candidatus Cloacimonadota bacterium]MDD4676654.1 MATE family efflux transporter [Candidatus Cloacimonadota bacterium]